MGDFVASFESLVKWCPNLALFHRAGRSSEKILPEWKTVLPDADFLNEGSVGPREPLRDQGPAHYAESLGGKCAFGF